jgi:drug/metabolite transporter (DMT)-like permease
MLLPCKILRNFRPSDYFNHVCILAVVAAVCTACYTIVDGNALRILRELPGCAFDSTKATLIYLVIEATSCSIWLFIFVVLSTRERNGTREVLKNFRGPAVITDVGLYFTYGLVLASMNFVTNITYVAALRQLSIPIGAMFGMVFLKEPRFLPKIIGVGIIFGGIVLVAAK